ncbi:MAG: sugar phosphate isomerase/epimerase [Clostridia bacterium]|nr:sugar phosphate isomerase/epimerase [Clostridia bacterium]
MNYGVQMFSIKDVASVDLKLALKTVAEHGYKSVEFAGFFGNSAEDVKSWLDEYGLAVTGTHTGLAMLTPETIADTVAYHKAIGCDYVIVPHANWSNEENLNKNIEAMKYAAEYLAREGMTLGFHNHSGELIEYPYGKTPIDEIINNTTIELEPDVFFFCNCGLDPLEFCEKYSSRIKFIHLKDGTYPTDMERDYTNIHAGAESTVSGEGMVPVDAIVAWAREHGKEIVVEVECKGAGAVVTKQCIDYLRSKEVNA